MKILDFSLRENLRIALRSLAANKLRSGLNMLGIIIGVAAVVALLAIGDGAAASITGEVESLGSNAITIFPGKISGPNGASSTADIYYSDYEVLASGLDGANAVVPLFQSTTTVTYGKETLNVRVAATTPEFAAARSYQVAFGRFIEPADLKSKARVAVLGAQTARDLFGSASPLGRQIKIDGVQFEVVGVLRAKGSSGLLNDDELVVIPLDTGYSKVFGLQSMSGSRRRLSSILLSASSSDGVDTLIAQASYLLRREHDLAPGAESDFSILSQNSMLAMLSSITQILTIFLGAIAAISLLVGGIGIMNIMLVSVTERTREIGLRKAVGAKSRIILAQFLIETLVISLLGGLLGILLGWAIAALVAFSGLIPAQVSLSSILLAVGFSAAVGIFFGLYPAYRAACLRPIEALRYE
jgi:putative ABC transport system permease protein